MSVIVIVRVSVGVSVCVRVRVSVRIATNTCKHSNKARKDSGTHIWKALAGDDSGTVVISLRDGQKEPHYYLS